MDKPGRVAAKETEDAALALGYSVVGLEWGLEAGKDVTELYMNGNIDIIRRVL